MNSPIAEAEEKAKAGAASAQSQAAAIERRRRRRAKISAQVHVRAVNSPEPFEAVCMSVDVSRDGLLFTSQLSGYSKGQRLEVTFPYSSMAGAINQGQSAEVVRIVQQSGGKHGIAVQFVSAKS